MLVLASASPRRQELLRNAGIAFVVQPTDIPEVPREGELPRLFAERLAREKASAVARQRPDHFVLGADTIVVVGGRILGKPTDASDAAHMLRLLSGRTHEVITGVCLAGLRPNLLETGTGLSDRFPEPVQKPKGLKPQRLWDPSGTPEGVPFQITVHETGSGNRKTGTTFEDVRSESTLVTMNALSDTDVDAYIATDEPMDKAGAYAIQGIASRWIPRIEGDYSNVVGLPVALVFSMLRKHGAI